MLKLEQNTSAVLLPAIGELGNKFKSYAFYNNSPAFVPIISRSSISLVLDFYIHCEFKIYIAIESGKEKYFSQELSFYKEHIEFLVLDKTAGINETIDKACKLITEEDIIINVVTSIPVVLVQENTALIGYETFSHNSYSGVKIADGKTTFKSKFDSGNLEVNPFQGIIRANKLDLQKGTSLLSDKQDLLKLAEWLHTNRRLIFKYSDWLDTGHEENYPSIRKKILSSRSFNRLLFNPESGLLTKESDNRLKFLNEIDYTKNLPIELQVFFPRIFSVDRNKPSVSMEYYGYPNLSEYQLYRSIEGFQWKRIFKLIKHYITRNSLFKNAISSELFLSFTYDKSVNRLSEFLKESDFKKYDEFEINGLKCQSFGLLSELVRDKLVKMYQLEFQFIMHGDLCFNNILYDIFSETIRFIDPRGSISDDVPSIFGDVRYDLAKLLHSAVGNYDYMVNNLFELRINENVIDFQFPLRQNAHDLKFECEQLIQDLNVNLNDVYLLMGLLFLSMTPLHSDNQKRQKIMFAQGTYYLNYAIKRYV